MRKGNDGAVHVPVELEHHGRRGHESVFRIANAFKRVSIAEWQIPDVRQDEFLVYLLGQRVRCFLQGPVLFVNHGN